MTHDFRGMMLVSAAALAVSGLVPVIQAFGPQALMSVALARGGSDDGGSSGGSSGSGRSGSGRGGSDDHGGGGHDDRGGDDHGRGRDDGPNHDVGDDNPGNQSGRRNGGRADRPETVLTVSDASLRGLLDGSLVATDQLGRRLEIEIEREHGARIVKAQVHGSDARRNPGAITSVNIIPAAAR